MEAGGWSRKATFLVVTLTSSRQPVGSTGAGSPLSQAPDGRPGVQVILKFNWTLFFLLLTHSF